VGAAWVFGGRKCILLKCCCCCENSCEDEDVSAVGEQAQQDGLGQPLIRRDEENIPTPAPQRYSFLDNLKTTLTGLVITFHVCSSFREGAWYLTIVDGPGAKNTILIAFTLVCQSFFMTLFFLISGFFAASSFDRKGREEFVRSKIKRLLLPFIVCSCTIYPITAVIEFQIKDDPIIYFPHASVTWYLIWLFIFCLVYSTLVDGSSPSVETTGALDAEAEEYDLPKRKTRLMYGFFVCGIGMLVFAMVVVDNMFYGMPVAVGSFVCDILMFIVGITAYRRKWFDGRSLADRLDIPVTSLYIWTLVEGSFVALFSVLFVNNDNFGWVICLFISGGIFNVDMNMVLLTFFQARFDYTTPFSKKFAKASFTAYLVHPPIVVSLTALYIQLYNLCADENLEFEDSDDDDHEFDSGISDWGYFIGFVFVQFFTHAIVWPLSVWMSGLPVLKAYL